MTMMQAFTYLLWEIQDEDPNEELTEGDEEDFSEEDDDDDEEVEP